jgi:hypothetical protein
MEDFKGGEPLYLKHGGFHSRKYVMENLKYLRKEENHYIRPNTLFRIKYILCKDQK